MRKEKNMICFNCKGNGYLRLSWEGERSIEQCKVCNSQGEVKDDEHYHQTWSDGVSEETTSFYYGPPLDPEGFKNYKIYGIEPSGNGK
jgi:DnaJ-class molecular chaperone